MEREWRESGERERGRRIQRESDRERERERERTLKNIYIPFQKV